MLSFYNHRPWKLWKYVDSDKNNINVERLESSTSKAAFNDWSVFKECPFHNLVIWSIYSHIVFFVKFASEKWNYFFSFLSHQMYFLCMSQCLRQCHVHVVLLYDNVLYNFSSLPALRKLCSNVISPESISFWLSIRFGKDGVAIILESREPIVFLNVSRGIVCFVVYT